MYQLRGLYILTDQERAKRKKAHKDRLAKIKNRDGSTYTKPPTVVLALVTNPRKQALKAEFNQITEQENRDMLGRISRIMTAPPKVTDEEYKKMKKLCNSLKSSRESYENGIAIKHNKKFFDRLHTVDSYYKRDKWESDYQRQKITQKFMRQVNYERPTDYQEPLQLESLYKLRNESAPSSNSSSLSHMGNIRKLRDTYSADSVSLLKKKSFYLDSYDEDGFESEVNNANDLEKEGFNRPESRHMNSRSDEVNQVNSMAMASLFHKDRIDNNDNNQDDGNDNYSDGGWDEFNEDSKPKENDQEKLINNNNNSEKTNQYWRDMKIPMTKSSSNNTTSVTQMRIKCNKCNDDIIKINLTNNHSASYNNNNNNNYKIDLSIDVKLRDHYPDISGKNIISEDEQILNIVNSLEIQLKDEIYQAIINPLTTLAAEDTLRNNITESGVVDNEFISAVEGMFSNSSNSSSSNNPIDESSVRATTPLYFANEISYDDSLQSRIGDGLSSIEKVSHSITRFIKIDFVHPIITTTTAAATVTNETSQTSKTTTTSLLQRKSSIIDQPQQSVSTILPTAPSSSSSSSSTSPFPRTSSMIQLTSPMNQPYSEVLEATVAVNSLDDDKAQVDITFHRNSETHQSHSEIAAITVNSVITTIINLPSILLADDFLKHEYFVNLANGAGVEYTLNDQMTKPFMKLT